MHDAFMTGYRQVHTDIWCRGSPLGYPAQAPNGITRPPLSSFAKRGCYVQLFLSSIFLSPIAHAEYMLRNSQIGRDSCYTLQTTSSPHGPMHMLYMLYFKITGTAIAKTMFAPDQPQGLDLLRNLWQYPLRYDDASCQSSGPARALNRRRDPVAAASSPGRPLARCVCPPLLPAPPGL